MTPYTLASAPSAASPSTTVVATTTVGRQECDPFALSDSLLTRTLPATKNSRGRRASRGTLQEGLRRMEEEFERQLATGQNMESTEGDIDLRREIERLRAEIEELRNFPSLQDEEEPPPSYAAGSYVAD